MKAGSDATEIRRYIVVAKEEVCVGKTGSMKGMSEGRVKIGSCPSKKNRHTQPDGTADLGRKGWGKGSST